MTSTLFYDYVYIIINKTLNKIVIIIIIIIIDSCIYICYVLFVLCS